jgi:hypothetical protein
MMSHAYPPKSKMAESSLICDFFCSNISRKIGKRDLRITLKVLLNEIIKKKYCRIPLKSMNVFEFFITSVFKVGQLAFDLYIVLIPELN